MVDLLNDDGYDMTDETKIVDGYSAGAIGRVAELHALYYSKVWNFEAFFEAKVASELSEFMTRYDASQDLFLTVQNSNRIEGSITVDGSQAHKEGAHLRWFILSNALRGQGYGLKILQEAIEYCKAKQYPSIYLWTFAGLEAAQKLYTQTGFELVHEASGEQWGSVVTEQKYVLELL